MASLEDSALIGAIRSDAEFENTLIEVITTAADTNPSSDDSDKFPLSILIGASLGSCIVGVTVFVLVQKARASFGTAKPMHSKSKSTEMTRTNNPMRGASEV